MTLNIHRLIIYFALLHYIGIRSFIRNDFILYLCWMDPLHAFAWFLVAVSWRNMIVDSMACRDLVNGADACHASTCSLCRHCRAHGNMNGTWIWPGAYCEDGCRQRSQRECRESQQRNRNPSPRIPASWRCHLNRRTWTRTPASCSPLCPRIRTFDRLASVSDMNRHCFGRGNFESPSRNTSSTDSRCPSHSVRSCSIHITLMENVRYFEFPVTLYCLSFWIKWYFYEALNLRKDDDEWT